ncbi:hypothetical protein OIU79_014170 [Salix purpurea]|uniref:Uncharacterized protein n=1 Tax=Salix purpurea TaxID=77065 RepID=A0A9Q0PPZ8_SALPP|nr:hypothetical protein OIU79_014170 [Salix purpurea]
MHLLETKRLLKRIKKRCVFQDDQQLEESLSISFLAFLLRISTLTLALLSILMYGFLNFFRALTLDLIDCTRFSSRIAI